MLRVTVRQIEDNVAEYAKKNGITVVLPVTGSRMGIAPAVVWADESTDITKAIMDAMGIEERKPEDAAQDKAEAPKGE